MRLPLLVALLFVIALLAAVALRRAGGAAAPALALLAVAVGLRAAAALALRRPPRGGPLGSGDLTVLEARDRRGSSPPR